MLADENANDAAAIRRNLQVGINVTAQSEGA
jgi:hypothetical protein